MYSFATMFQVSIQTNNCQHCYTIVFLSSCLFYCLHYLSFCYIFSYNCFDISLSRTSRNVTINSTISYSELLCLVKGTFIIEMWVFTAFEVCVWGPADALLGLYRECFVSILAWETAWAGGSTRPGPWSCLGPARLGMSLSVLCNVAHKRYET